MKKAKYLFLALFLIGITKEFLYAHGPATHIVLGRSTYEIWRDFDRRFYDSLTKTPSNEREVVNKMKLLKFYYIGLTLPDMFVPEGQGAIRELIDALYPKREFLCDPLHIKDVTYCNTRDPIIFIDPQPNQNLTVLRKMAEYARSQNWSPYEKALIYGAYMRVIQDLYAHIVLQPSRFGYGYAVDSDSALTEPILRFGETWHEIFTQTYITDWYAPINYLFFGVQDPRTNRPQLRRAPMQFYREYDNLGQNYQGWQDLNFLPVQRFIEAANAVGYRTSNLTQERLESYLHGWAMILFLAYGYRSNGSDVGGIFSHPNWTHRDIRSFWADIGDDFPHHWAMNIPFLDSYIRRRVYKTIYNAFNFLDTLPPNLPWPEYFEFYLEFNRLWDCVPPERQTPEALREFRKFSYNLFYWNEYSQILEPYSRSSYSREVGDAEAWLSLAGRKVNRVRFIGG